MEEDSNISQSKQENVSQIKNQEESTVLDPQTLENLAAFLSRDNEEFKQEANQKLNKSDIEGQEELSIIVESPKAQKTIMNSISPSRSESEKRSPNKSRSRSRSRSKSKEKNQQRWVYCCSKCKKTGKKGKNCVCIVPASQRRISISQIGCSTCACFGCSKEDIQLRQDEKKKLEEIQIKSESFESMRNGCCKECMKAFSSTKKACICQVPSSVRRRKLPDTGCIFCGCYGCNPEDTQKRIEKESRRNAEKAKISKYIRRTKSRNNNKSDDSMRSDSKRRSRSRSRSRDSKDNYEEELDNFNNSFIGNFLRNSFSIYPPLMGFGIPQRTYSYIYGKPPSR